MYSGSLVIGFVLVFTVSEFWLSRFRGFLWAPVAQRLCVIGLSGVDLKHWKLRLSFLKSAGMLGICLESDVDFPIQIVHAYVIDSPQVLTCVVLSSYIMKTCPAVKLSPSF